MRVLYTNLVENATLAATNENANYPIENVYDQFLTRKYKATASTSTVTITWASDQTINCFAVAYHNISSVTYTFKNAAAATLDSGTLTGGSDIFDGDVIYLSSALTTVRTLTLAFTGSADPFYIGYIGAGVYVQMPGFSPGIRFGYADQGEVNKSRGGQLIGSQYTMLRNCNVSFISSIQSEADTVLTFWRTVTRVKPFVFDLYEENRDSEMDYPFFCSVEEFRDFSKEDTRGTAYNYQMTFGECK